MINRFRGGEVINRIFLGIGLLLPTFALAQTGEVAVSNFSGVWEYKGTTELSGTTYVVQQRYTFYQRGHRICGCLERSGAPNTMLEQYAISGEAHRDYADLWMDGGTPRSATYSPRYPFEPDDLIRLKKYAKKLIMGNVHQPKNLRTFVFPKDDQIVYLANMPLKKLPEAPNSNVCDLEEQGATRRFLDACLSDPVKLER
ncbi:hypothetical protein [Duganella levis]|uniref:Lipocalin-like domain-containing protein n=1 Tax=Duganella levis TaxID=2692169 RepID=A0ABW9W7Q2_9BURK|nr:hypothetical protein [Duganella levis]MYN29645.1 hypothetical protein [Duganella levis]